MRSIFLAASAIALLSTAPAMAQTSASTQVQLTATVGAACGIGNHLSGAAANPLWDQTDIVVNLADANGQFDGDSFGNRSFGNVWCNAPATTSIEVGSLATGTRGTAPADASSFTNEFDLVVTTNAGVYINGSPGLVLDTSTTSTGIVTETGSTAGAFETGMGQYSGFTVDIVNPGNKRPVAGSYNGYVKFTASVS